MKRAKGFAWEFRVNVVKGGVTKTEYVTLSGAEFPTEKLARQKLQGLLLSVNDGKAANYTQTIVFGTLLDRYLDEEMPTKSSTRGSYTSIIQTHIRPKWGGVALTEMKAAAIRTWLNALPLAPLSKGHVRSLLHKMFDLAQLWEYVDLGRNPIELVKVKGVTKREKEVVILTTEQAVAIIESLAEPYSLMVMTVAACGLRLSEMLGLQWDDIDWEKKVITIKRSAYRGTVDEAKTKASHAEVPLPDELAALLISWKERVEQKQDKSQKESVWVFANPSTGLPYQGPSIQQRWLRPAGEKIGMVGVGFHTFRHSHKTWLDSLGTPMGVMKDLLRHSNISVTMNVYGRTLSPEKRLYNDKLAGLLFPAPTR
jgi:integrase